MIWPRRFTQKTLLFTFIILFIHFAVYPQYLIPLEILFFGIAVIILFYVGLNFYTKRWRSINGRSFTISILITSVLIKVIFLIATLFLTKIVDPKSFPFEIGGAADSMYYHVVASDVSDHLFSKDLNDTLRKWFKQKGDFGYPTYVGFIYRFFWKDTILVRLISILFSSFTVVMIYKLARNIYSEDVGRLAGILAMLMPALLWFDTMLLKENIMIFLIFLCLYTESKIVLSKKVRIVNIAILAPTISLLFFFRAFLPWLVILVTIIYFVLNLSNRRVSRAAVFLSFFVIVGILAMIMIQSGSFGELKVLLVQSQKQLENELVSTAMQRGLTYNTALVLPFLFAGSIVTPFPSLLYFEYGQIGIVDHFFVELIRNALYFFGFLGIFISIKKYFKKASLVYLYTLGYILILTLSGVSFQDRFQLPSLPGMLILIAVGFVEGKKYFRKWNLYLFVMGIAVILWNLFKLQLRGLL